MNQITYTNHSYKTPSGSATLWGKLFPSFSFYTSLLSNVFFSSRKARKGTYDDEAWRLSSLKILRDLEHTGLTVTINGIEHLQKLDSPCVIIGNHVSMMETLVLPAIVNQEKPITFVIKESLMEYPVFKHVMRSRNPIAVTRNNPRQDLKTVLTEGIDRLQHGTSVTIFPQTTRGTDFDPKQFSSIGVKLAQKAGVPVLPLALKTDAWTNGQWIKDLGKILPERNVHFAFGAPFMVNGKGREEHEKVINFISRKLKEWQ